MLTCYSPFENVNLLRQPRTVVEVVESFVVRQSSKIRRFSAVLPV